MELKIKNSFFKTIAAFIFMTAAFPIFSNVKFKNLSLNETDGLLFSVEHKIPGTPDYSTMFASRLGENKALGEAKILTCFPEKMELLDAEKILQVRSRYGTAWYYTQEKKLKWVEKLNGIPVEYTHTATQLSSPNGKYICCVRQIKNSTGQMILKNAVTGEQKVLDINSNFNYSKINAKWSPESKALLYEKNENIYFVTPEAAFKNIQLPEEYRKIGRGKISSVQWTEAGDIIYIDGDIIYRIRENELYTRGLYSSLLGSGTIIGRLSKQFNPAEDLFWCNKKGTEFVVTNGVNFANHYSIKKSGFDFANLENTYQLTGLKGSPISINVFWNNDAKSIPVLYLDLLSYDGQKRVGSVYLLKEKMEHKLTVENSIEPKISAGKKFFAATDGGALKIFETQGWNLIYSENDEETVSFLWASGSTIFVGGKNTVKKLSINSDAAKIKSEMLFIASADDYCWNEGNILCKINSTKKTYIYFPQSETWKEFPLQSAWNENKEKNSYFRVFEEKALNWKYENSILVRSLSGDVITYPIFEETQKIQKPQKKVSIILDAVDNAEGLAKILHTLNEFNIKATFFINGEFLRRYPLEAKQISSSGNPCASGFYSTADLLSNNFIIDSDFIKRGLARNEDDFFNVTGKELSLLWHAPNYNHNNLMIEAGNKAGYRYLKDNIILEKENNLSEKEIIDHYIKLLDDGKIIQITIGSNQKGMKENLYSKFDLLIAAILDNGYSIIEY